MKKTITLTEDQVLDVLVALGLHIKHMEGCLQFSQERGDAEWVSRDKKTIATLERVREKIRRAKWRL